MMKVLEKGTDFASEVEIGSGVLWLPYKNILEIVTRAIQDNSSEAFAELDSCAKKCKGDFVNFLNYRGKSTSDREILKKSTSDGIFLKGQDSRQILHPQLINETLLLSDIFEINEFLALDLLATAEALKDEYPGWGRGLISVLLYFEGRLCMIQTMSTMITAIPGKSWHQEACYPRVYAIFKAIIANVFKNDVTDSLLDLFGKCDIKSQLELLDTNLALGDWRHRFEINRMAYGIREGIAFIIFAISAQQDLNWKGALRIMEYLKANVKLEEEAKLDKAQILLITAVVFSITNHLQLIGYDRNFAKELLKYLKDSEQKTAEDGGFQCPELLELFRLAFHIMTHKAISESNINSLHAGMGNSQDVVKDDEDAYYFKRDVFAFLRDKMFADPTLLFNMEEIIVRRYHHLLTNFITFMPMKVKEMKGRSDDAAKTAALYQNQGFVRPPNLPQDYESFMECLGMFYLHEQENFSTDFFDPDIRHLALNKLARGACIDSPTMFVPNAKFMAGLAKGASEDVFDLLKQNGHNFSFDHFFESIMQYLSSFGSGTTPNGGFHGTNLFASETFQRVVHDSMRIQMNPAEVQGICAYLDLVRTMCDNSPKVASFFTNQKLPWIRILLETAKIRGIPREIRAKMIGTAAAMISEQSSGEFVSSTWEMFYQVRLIGQDNVDLKDELDEHESRMETYQLTINMLKLLDALVNARFKRMENDASANIDGVASLDNGAFDVYVSYVRDTVLLRAMYRSYRSMNERWEISTLSLEILSKLLDYVPQLMLQLLCGSPFLRSVLSTLAECVRARDSSPLTMHSVDRCSFACLNLLRRALHRQSYFLHRRELTSIRQEAVIVGMQELLMKIIPESGRPEYIISILKFIDTLQPTQHKQAALDILSLTLADRDDIDVHLYAAVITDTNLVALLRYMFITTLYESPDYDEVRKSVLQIIRVSVVHSSPNFAMMLLGVDKKVDFQNAGVAGYPRTVLHAILDNAPNLPDAFSTLLTLIRDSRLWSPLLRYLKTNHFFSNFIKENFPSPTMDAQDIGYLLKCVAVELKTTRSPGPLAKTIIGEGSSKFQEILNLLDLDDDDVDLPELEFFDQDNVMQAMKACEYFDSKLKIRVIRVDMLENLLKDEITKLEKNTVLKLRHTVHAEAKDVVKFAVEFNSNRWKEASKANMFDGWRQCLEVLVLSTETLKLAGVDFVTSILRVLLNKVTGTSDPPREYFCRLAAETVLTLSAVMGTFKGQVNATTLNVILNHVCKWIAEEQSARVRTTLYAAVLHVVRMFKSANDTGSSTVTSFAMILENLCKDCCQSKEIGKMQAMYMMGEIIRLTADRGLVGSSSNNYLSSSASMMMTNKTLLNATTTTDNNYGGGGGNQSTRAQEDKSGNFTEFSTFNTSLSPITPSTAGGGGNISFHNSTMAAAAASGASGKKQQTLGNAHTTPHSHLNVMSYMFAKGFLGNLVEAILTVDDSDLVKLFSNQPLQTHLKSLYVFEAKVSLLCRFASTGRRAILFLMDTNLVHKFADMRVLQIQYFQEDGSYLGLPSSTSDTTTQQNTTNAGNNTTFRDMSSQPPTRKGVMDLLFTSVLKLLHSMVDAAPKNVLLAEQIWHFFTIHDLPLSSLLSRSIIESDESNVGCSLLLALLAKTAKLLPNAAFTGRTSIMSRVFDILKLHATSPTYSDFRIGTLKQALLFLHNYSHNNDAVRELKRKGNTHGFRLFLTNKLSQDPLGAANPEEEPSLGIIVKITSDLAGMIVNWNTGGGGMTRNKLDSLTTILELGLSMAHEHIEVFLTDGAYRGSAKKFCEDFIPALDNRLVKFTSDAAKIIEKGEFIEMLLLRIRRMVHAPYKH